MREGERQPIHESAINVEQASLELGKEVHQYFSELIPNAARIKNQTLPVLEKGSDQELDNERASTDFDPQVFDKMRQRLPQSVRESDGEFLGEIEEVPQNPESKEAIDQTSFFRFSQDGGINIIEESVFNRLEHGKMNFAQTELIIRNHETGLSLNIQQGLVPEGFYLAPQDLIPKDYSDDKEGGLSGSSPPVDLKDYKGTKGSEAKFSAYPRLKTVAYGDLTQKGRMLSLLHEAAHAWQGVYYPEDFGKIEFRSLYGKVRSELDEIYKRWEKFNEFNQDPKRSKKFTMKDFVRVAIEPRREELKNLGVEIDENRLFAGDVDLEPGEIRLTSSKSKGQFIVQSEKFDELLPHYEQQEREAWAHAVKVLSFLRERGFDLEPELKTTRDFEQLIQGDAKLSSYQRVLSGLYESAARKVGFTKKKR